MTYLIRQLLLLYECTTPYDYLQPKLLIKGTECKPEHFDCHWCLEEKNDSPCFTSSHAHDL